MRRKAQQKIKVQHMVWKLYLRRFFVIFLTLTKGGGKQGQEARQGNTGIVCAVCRARKLFFIFYCVVKYLHVV